MGSMRIAEWVDGLQARGTYTFAADDVARAVGGSVVARRGALGRLVRQQRVVALRRGFYVIVPLEHRVAGAPPPPWWIDELMRWEGARTTSRSCPPPPSTVPLTKRRRSSRS